MTIHTNRLDVDLVRSLLDYNPETGFLFWKSRPLELFPNLCACNTWNARYAGKRAMTAMTENGYNVGNIFNVRYRAHHVAWVVHHGYWVDEIDHINGCRTDNRLVNLRSVDRTENNRNQCRRKNNRSGRTGVRFDGKNWRAEICIDYKNISLGAHETFEKAVQARINAEKLYGFHPNHDRCRA